MRLNENFRINFPEQKIYISRDHNWAFSAWEIGRLRGYIKPGATIVHIDGHVDYLDPMMEIGDIATEEEALNLGSSFGIAEFIIPAQKIGTIENVLMISNDGVDISDTPVERAYTLNHYEQQFRRKWFEQTEGKSVILDLDLDFFNFNYQDLDCNPVMLPETLIRQQLLNIRKYMWEWDMVTVALSPEYCGGEEVSEYLLDLFLDVFQLDRSEAVPW